MPTLDADWGNRAEEAKRLDDKPATGCRLNARSNQARVRAARHDSKPCTNRRRQRWIEQLEECCAFGLGGVWRWIG